MSKYDTSKFKLKFDKPRKQKPTEDTTDSIDTTQKAAKKKWWEKWNLGIDIGSNKKDVSKDKY